MKTTVTQSEIAKKLGVYNSTASMALRKLKPEGRNGRENIYNAAEAWQAMSRYYSDKQAEFARKAEERLNEMQGLRDAANEEYRKAREGMEAES